MIESDARQEAERVIHAADAAHIRLRVLGGLAVYITCPSARGHERLKRGYADLDLMGLEKEGANLPGLFAALGYQPDQRFNALHGRRRMIFYPPEGESHVDVFLDRFEMCHTLDLRERLADGLETLYVVDLLMTKLQIVQLNEKDMKDCLAILLDHSAGEDAREIDLAYLTRLTGNDWGLYTTLADNLENIAQRAAAYLRAGELATVSERIRQIRAALENSPKTLRWKVRAKIGRRIEWYELPDEVRR